MLASNATWSEWGSSNPLGKRLRKPSPTEPDPLVHPGVNDACFDSLVALQGLRICPKISPKRFLPAEHVPDPWAIVFVGHFLALRHTRGPVSSSSPVTHDAGYRTCDLLHGMYVLSHRAMAAPVTPAPFSHFTNNPTSEFKCTPRSSWIPAEWKVLH